METSARSREGQSVGSTAGGPDQRPEKWTARSTFLAFAAPVDRNAHIDASPAPLTAHDVDFAVEHCGPFPHAEQSKGLCARRFAPGHAAPVILHFEDHLAAFLPQVNVYLGR